MNKNDLVRKISKDSGISQKQARLALDSLTSSIKLSLEVGEKVTLLSLGTFTVTSRPARIINSPVSAKKIKVNAKRVPKFKASSKLQYEIGGGSDDTGPMKTKIKK
jgi:DNA-binding protein HU-beta